MLARGVTWRGQKLRINRRSVIALKRGDWLTDDLLPGFKARRPNRLVLYGVNIRLNGRMRWISLGSEAELTPDQARNEAERVRGLRRQRRGSHIRSGSSQNLTNDRGELRAVQTRARHAQTAKSRRPFSISTSSNVSCCRNSGCGGSIQSLQLMSRLGTEFLARPPTGRTGRSPSSRASSVG